MKNEALIPDPNRARRRRARWTVLALVLGYVPMNLATDRWLPMASGAIWYFYMAALMVAWWFSLRIDWVRRDFQQRAPDPPRRDKTRP